jgi:hypothetical protein
MPDLIRPVMPDLIRHPPSLSSAPTGRWTPDQVRGDGSVSDSPISSATSSKLPAERPITVVERVALRAGANPHNEAYLKVKRARSGHQL